VLPHDLLRVLEGHEVNVGGSDGEGVFLRLYTPDEFLAEQHEAAARFGAPKIDRARAEELTRPLGKGSSTLGGAS
jgi:hypothetical protein